MTLHKVGEFYELTGKDAEEASEALDLVITRKMPSNEKVVGFPVKAADGYINRLLKKGFSVSFDDSCSGERSFFTLKDTAFVPQQLTLF